MGIAVQDQTDQGLKLIVDPGPVASGIVDRARKARLALAIADPGQQVALLIVDHARKARVPMAIVPQGPQDRLGLLIVARGPAVQAVQVRPGLASIVVRQQLRQSL